MHYAFADDMMETDSLAEPKIAEVGFLECVRRERQSIEESEVSEETKAEAEVLLVSMATGLAGASEQQELPKDYEKTEEMRPKVPDEQQKRHRHQRKPRASKMSQVGQLQRGQHYLAVVETIAENAVLTQLAA